MKQLLQPGLFASGGVLPSGYTDTARPGFFSVFMFDKTDLRTQREIIEFTDKQAVPVEIDLPAVRAFDPAAVILRIQGDDPT